MQRFVKVIAALVIHGACSGNDTADSASRVADTAAVDSTPGAPGRLLFVGTSLTAGLGLEPDEAYPALVARRIDSLALPYRVDSAGYSGETSPGALRRIDGLGREAVDILLVQTGANDGLPGLSV